MSKCTFGCLKLSPVALLVYFCLLNILIYLDRGVLAALIPTLQEEKNMDLNDLEAGVLGSVFMFGFMAASPIFANLSQTYHPFNLISIGVTIWGGSAFLAGMSRDFWMITIARTFSGIGEASFVCLAAPILLEIAPTEKKNLWISIFYTALTIGYALGYVLAPPIKNAFGGWYYVFYLEAIASIPFIIITIFAYKDPKLIFKKESKQSIMVQFKILIRNPVYVLIVLGLGAYMFTVGGIGFWGPSILQHEFDASETASTFSLGAITIISGLVATLVGSFILDKMMKQYRLQFESRQISEDKFNCYRTEKSTKLITRVTAVSLCCSLTGAIVAPLLGGPLSLIIFLILLAIAEFFLFL